MAVSRLPSAEPLMPPVASIDSVARSPAASRYQCPPSDFHSTPASTCGSRSPHAGTSCAFAATAPCAPPGVRNWASTRAPAPRQVSARVHTQAPEPLESGSGCAANRQAFTDRTPCPRTAPSEQAYGAQSARASGPETSFAAPGRPVVRRAGTSSPRSVATRVSEPSVSSSTFQEAHAPDCCCTGLASGAVTPSVRVSSRASEPGAARSRTAAPVTQGAVR
ncbi:hypothetical protein H4N49_10545 [Streptomyces sp. DHE17-7]|nr:hypothetical protein [Streptomyces sp. DHE17-7]